MTVLDCFMRAVTIPLLAVNEAVIAEVASTAEKMAAEYWALHRQVRPRFELICCGLPNRNPVLVLIPYEVSESDKPLYYQILRLFIAEYNCVAAIMVSECWVMTRPLAGRTPEEILRTEGKPEQAPDRQNAVVIALQSASVKPYMKLAVPRDHSGLDWQLLSAGFDSGYLSTLFPRGRNDSAV